MKILPYPAPHLPVPKPVPERSRSEETRQLVPTEVESSRSASGSPILRTKVSQVDKTDDSDSLSRSNQRPSLASRRYMPPRPHSASAVQEVSSWTIRPPLFVFIRMSPRQPLIELDVSRIDTDREFFSRMRHVIRPRINIRLEFAEFHVDDPRHIRLLGAGKDAKPPGREDDDAWDFAPRPMRVVPPVGSDALTDYLIRSNVEFTLFSSLVTVLQRLPKSRRTIEQIMMSDERVIWGLDVSSSWFPQWLQNSN